MRRLLCLLGLHDWQDIGNDTNPEGRPVKRLACKHCPAQGGIFLDVPPL